MDDERREIISAIEVAFAGVSRGVVTLHEAKVIDVYGTQAERSAARTRDLEQDWREVPDSSIVECVDALPYFDPVSWRFYLPAFMRFGLRWLKDHRCSAMDRAIYSLALHDDPSLRNHQLQRFATLDSAQAEVVRRFLEFASRHQADCDARVAKQALETHWARG